MDASSDNAFVIRIPKRWFQFRLSTLLAIVFVAAVFSMWLGARWREPELCMSGYCPVALGEQRAWVQGDEEYFATHEGTKYFFSSKNARDKFIASPETFAALASGYDIVLLVDEAKREMGRRQHGLYVDAEGGIALFTSEATLQKFFQDSERYLEALDTDG
jgi:YHS domain-containing protein